MEFSLRPLGFIRFLQNNNRQAVNKMKWIENQKVQSKTVGIVLESLSVIVTLCVCVCVALRAVKYAINV